MCSLSRYHFGSDNIEVLHHLARLSEFFPFIALLRPLLMRALNLNINEGILPRGAFADLIPHMRNRIRDIPMANIPEWHRIGRESLRHPFLIYRLEQPSPHSGALVYIIKVAASGFHPLPQRLCSGIFHIHYQFPAPPLLAGKPIERRAMLQLLPLRGILIRLIEPLALINLLST